MRAQPRGICRPDAGDYAAGAAVCHSESTLPLRAAGEYAGQLAVHVNHLNTVLKNQTGQTTTALIHPRLLQEARVLLLHTDWSVAEVAFALGFRERSHFSAFFRQQGGAIADGIPAAPAVRGVPNVLNLVRGRSSAGPTFAGTN